MSTAYPLGKSPGGNSSPGGAPSVGTIGRRGGGGRIEGLAHIVATDGGTGLFTGVWAAGVTGRAIGLIGAFTTGFSGTRAAVGGLAAETREGNWTPGDTVRGGSITGGFDRTLGEGTGSCWGATATAAPSASARDDSETSKDSDGAGVGF